MGFVVGYAPCGLSPQIDGMPVIPKIGASGFTAGCPVITIIIVFPKAPFCQ